MKNDNKIYFQDELNDEVIENNLKSKKIDKNYKYISNNFLYNLFGNFAYYCVAKPITWFAFKFIRHISYKNRKVLKKHKTE